MGKNQLELKTFTKSTQQLRFAFVAIFMLWILCVSVAISQTISTQAAQDAISQAERIENEVNLSIHKANAAGFEFITIQNIAQQKQFKLDSNLLEKIEFAQAKSEEALEKFKNIGKKADEALKKYQANNSATNEAIFLRLIKDFVAQGNKYIELDKHYIKAIDELKSSFGVR